MRSMTGYGRSQTQVDGQLVTVEIKTANHRFLDLSFRLPRSFSSLEIMLRKRLSACFDRGSVTLSIIQDAGSAENAQVHVNLPLARAYHEAAGQLSQSLGIQGDMQVQTLLSLPDVLSLSPPETTPEALMAFIEEALEAACQATLLDRRREGEQLQQILTEHLLTLKEAAQALQTEADGQPALAYDKLVKRLASLPDLQLEPQRLAQEAALFADKCDITEEISRLLAHCQQMAQLIDSPSPVGREMDFLAQEMHREANTICSKSASLAVTRLGLACKAAAEKLREQIQNVE